MTTKTKRKPKKLFRVNIDMRYSEDVIVSASSASEARKKAWKKFRPKRKYFDLDADEE